MALATEGRGLAVRWAHSLRALVEYAPSNVESAPTRAFNRFGRPTRRSMPRVRTRACDTSHILPARPRRPTEYPLRALLQAVTVFTPPKKGVFNERTPLVRKPCGDGGLCDKVAPCSPRHELRRGGSDSFCIRPRTALKTHPHDIAHAHRGRLFCLGSGTNPNCQLFAREASETRGSRERDGS